MPLTLAAWLGAISWPIVSRVLKALGIGIVTYAGADLAVQSALSAAKASMGGVSLDVALLVARFGFFEYMSIVAGAAVSSLAWVQMKRIAVTATGS